MKIDDFKKVTSNIMANLNDQAKVTEYLSQLNDSYESTYTNNSVLQEQSKSHESEIQALKDTNMKLFLKIQEPQNVSAAENISPPETPPLSYDNVVESLGGAKSDG
jgi:cell division septum initiation protein DivIVA